MFETRRFPFDYLLVGLVMLHSDHIRHRKKHPLPMFPVFNSIQIVTLFAAAPFLLSWLFESATFPGVGAAKYVAAIAYCVFYIFMCVSTYNSVEKSGKR